MNESSKTVEAMQTHDTPLPGGLTRRQIGTSITSRRQELIILPTEKCNLRCTYCYEDFEIGKMEEQTQRAIELLIERRAPDLAKLTLSWFGGEPLVAKDVVLRISRYASEVAEQYGIVLNGNMTTNAYLLDQELFRELLACQLNFYQITFDGWQEQHDSHRRRVDGKGSFDRIWGNLVAMREVDQKFEVSVRVHIRRDNLESVEKFMREFYKTFGGDERFRPDFQHLRNLGGEGGKTIQDPLSLEDLNEVKQRLLRSYRSEFPDPSSTSAHQRSTLEALSEDSRAPSGVPVGESAGSRSDQDRSAGEPYICYAAHANSLLIRANGRIGKCTVAFNDERNDIGYLDQDGHVRIDNAKLRPWIAGLERFDLEALACPLATMPQVPLPSDLLLPGGKAIALVPV